MQNIHFDLNSLNFLVAQDDHIAIMDFDEVKLGNIYTDIGFAFHRLITTCIQQGEKDISGTIQAFLHAYKHNNPDITLDLNKLMVATYNRALRNIKANLHLKYNEYSQQWLTSISININRLKQIHFLQTWMPQSI